MTRNIFKIGIIGAFVFGFPFCIFANSPPALQSFFGSILILPLMVLLTALGGGYAVIRRLKKKKESSLLRKIIISVVLIFISGIFEGTSLLVTLAFSAIAVKRGIRMIFWGGRSNPNSQKELDIIVGKGKSIRLITCGLLIIIMAIGIVGLNIVFVGQRRQSNSTSIIENDLRELVKYQLKVGEVHREKSGVVLYEEPDTRNEGGPYIFKGNYFFPGERFWRIRHWSEYWGIEFTIGKDGKAFEIFIWPKRFPLFPYNYLISYPSFFADQTGNLRYIRVHSPIRCPRDAPIFDRVKIK